MSNVLYVENDIVLNLKYHKIKITSNVVEVMKSYIQYGFYSNEAGGVLIGRENLDNNNLIIEFCTEPMNKDKRLKNRFIRKDNGHIEFFQQLFYSNSGIYRYVGEWHTHPENIPSFSTIDKKNWIKINREMAHKEQYHFIVGREQICIWKCMGDELIEKIGNVEWKEVVKRAKNN